MHKILLYMITSSAIVCETVVNYEFEISVSGQTAYDAHLEKKRSVLRQALKREYILKTYNMKKAPDYQAS